MRSQTKICVLLGSTRVTGGIGRVSALLANGLSAAGYDVVLVEYYQSDKPEIYSIASDVERISMYSSPVSMTKALITGGIGRLRAVLRKEKPDVLIAAGALFFPISVLSVRGLCTKVICWEHSDPNGVYDHKFQAISRWIGIHWANACVVLTDDAYKTYLGKGCNHLLRRIYNPIDPDLLNKRGAYSESSHKIITVGRLEYQKNMQAAIEVASKLLPQFPDWEWHIYGEGPERANLEQLIERRGLSRQLKLMGRSSSLYEKYIDYSFLVLTSRYEGFPMVLLEGMGAGLPLISFDVPTGPNEIIESGINGFLAKALDVEEMTDMVRKLIECPEIRVSMSKANSQRASFFSFNSFLNQWMELFEEL